MDEIFYPLIIIGAGPAGLSATIYSRRARIKTLTFEKLTPGGQILTSEKIENYPGFPGPTPTSELISRMVKQAEICLLYTSPSPRDISGSRMPSSA